MNKPYVKNYDDNGVLLNPIKDRFLNFEPNRQRRRSELKKEKFHGESKNHHLTIFQNIKYHRVRQVIHCKDKKGNFTGERRVIEHYLTD